MLSELSAVILKCKIRALEDKVSPISDLCGRFIRMLAYTTAINKETPKFLEIGTGYGYSTFWIAIGALEANPNAVIYTVEIAPDRARLAMDFFEKAKLTNKVRFIIGDAKRVIETIEDTFDFVFIDARKEEYIVYLRKLEPKLSKGAIVIAHNVISAAHKMPAFIKELRDVRKWITIFLSTDPAGISISIKK